MHDEGLRELAKWQRVTFNAVLLRCIDDIATYLIALSIPLDHGDDTNRAFIVAYATKRMTNAIRAGASITQEAIMSYAANHERASNPNEGTSVNKTSSLISDLDTIGAYIEDNEYPVPYLRYGERGFNRRVLISIALQWCAETVKISG